MAVGAITPHDAERFAAELLPPHTALALSAWRSRRDFQARLEWVRTGVEERHAECAISVNPLDNTEVGGGYAVGDDDGFTPQPLTSAQVAAVAQHIAINRRSRCSGWRWSS